MPRTVAILPLLAFVLAMAACGQKDTRPLAERRSGHVTELETKGPAPQDYEVELPPAGVEVREFKSGGLTLKGWLGMPREGGTPRPALVFAHGGFAFGSEDYEMVEYWVDEGWIVFVPLLRGENGMPGVYDLFYHEVDDVIAAGTYVAGLPGVNAKAVFAMGHSTGGTRCILASMLPSPFAAIGSIGGAPDFKEWIRGQRELAPFDLWDRTEVSLRNPIDNVGSIQVPLVLVHGTEESWCRESTKDFVEAAKSAGKDVAKAIAKGDHIGCFDEAAEIIRRNFEGRVKPQ